MSYRIELDQAKCIAAGSCVLASPEVFDQDDEGGIVYLLRDDPGPDQEASVRSAAAACPARAIRVVES